MTLRLTDKSNGITEPFWPLYELTFHNEKMIGTIIRQGSPTPINVGYIVSYLGIGKWLFARFKMLPVTFVLTRVYYASSTVAMIRSGHIFPLGFSLIRRRAVSVDDLIFYLVTRSA
jgi:hypothetical protein